MRDIAIRLLVAVSLFESLETPLLADPPPDVLKAAFQARRAWCTAEIEWSVVDTDAGPAGASPRYFSSRYGGDDYLFIRRGDVHGCVYADVSSGNTNAEQGPPFAYSERRVLHKDAKQFSYTADSTSGRCYGLDNADRLQPCLEPLPLGLWPDIRFQQSLDEIPLERLGRYEVVEASGMLRVSAFPREGLELVWDLDPSCNYQPVRCAAYRDGAPVTECFTTYADYAGHLFPSRIEYFDTGESYRVISVLSATFDDPSHSMELTADLLDMPVGTNVGTEGGLRIWDGHALVSKTEAMQRRMAGELDYSRFWKLLADHKLGESQGRTPKPDMAILPDPETEADPLLWEEFTRRFIHLFGLTEEQAIRAWKIHAEERRAALKYLRDHDSELEEVARALKQAAADSSPEGAKKLAALEIERARLRAPVCKRFETRLKPQFVKLLTSGQKQAAIDAESKRPGSLGIKALLASADHERAVVETESGERAN